MLNTVSARITQVSRSPDRSFYKRNVTTGIAHDKLDSQDSSLFGQLIT